MTVKTDPPVSIAVLSAAMKLCEKNITVRYSAGEYPRPDSVIRDGQNRPVIRAWRLSTIRDWRPSVADRCAAILTALDAIPLDAA